MSIERCPYCFRPLGTFTHDPILLPSGSPYEWLGDTLNLVSDIKDRKYKGIYQCIITDVIEIRNNLITLETLWLSSINFTSFSPLDSTSKYQITGQHIKEMRDSVEKLLIVFGLTKTNYFNEDEDGNTITRPEGAKTEWTDPITLATDLTKFQIKYLHIEELRHYLKSIIMREDFPLDPLNPPDNSSNSAQNVLHDGTNYGVLTSIFNVHGDYDWTGFGDVIGGYVYSPTGAPVASSSVSLSGVQGNSYITVTGGISANAPTYGANYSSQASGMIRTQISSSSFHNYFLPADAKFQFIGSGGVAGGCLVLRLRVYLNYKKWVSGTGILGDPKIYQSGSYVSVIFYVSYSAPGLDTSSPGFQRYYLTNGGKVAYATAPNPASETYAVIAPGHIAFGTSGVRLIDGVNTCNLTAYKSLSDFGNVEPFNIPYIDSASLLQCDIFIHLACNSSGIPSLPQSGSSSVSLTIDKLGIIL